MLIDVWPGKFKKNWENTNALLKKEFERIAGRQDNQTFLETEGWCQPFSYQSEKSSISTLAMSKKNACTQMQPNCDNFAQNVPKYRYPLELLGRYQFSSDVYILFSSY